MREGNSFRYRRHIFTGGHGCMPVSNHAMAWFGSAGGTLSLSEKWFGELPSTLKKPDPARRRSIFATSIRFDDVTRMPLPEGGSADFRRYPIAEKHTFSAGFKRTAGEACAMSSSGAAAIA